MAGINGSNCLALNGQGSVLQLIIEFLQNEKFYNAATVLQDEASMRAVELSTKVTHIANFRKMITNGEWALSHKLLSKLVAKVHVRGYQYHLFRQEYLELINSKKGEDFQKCHQYLTSNLKSLEDIADAHDPPEFKELCYLLTCSSVAESTAFRPWMHRSKAREKLATELCDSILRYYQASGALSRPTSIYNSLLVPSDAQPTDRLTLLLRQAHAFQVSIASSIGAKAAKNSPTDKGSAQSYNPLQDYSPGDRPSTLAAICSTQNQSLSNKYGLLSCVTFQSVTCHAESHCASMRSLVLGGTDSGHLLAWDLSPAADSDESEQPQSGTETPLHALLVAPVASCIAGQNQSLLVEGQPQPYFSRVRDLALSPTGSLLVTALSDSRLVFSNIDTAALLSSARSSSSSIDRSHFFSDTIAQVTNANADGGLYTVAFNAEGNRVVCGGFDRKVDIYDVTTQARIKTFTGHTAAVAHVGFNSPGNLVYSASRDGTVRFWDLLSGVSVSRIDPLAPNSCQKLGEEGDGHERSASSSELGRSAGGISSATLSQDGRYLLVTNRFCPARLVDLRMARVVSRYVAVVDEWGSRRNLDASQSPFYRACFAANDTLVALGTGGGVQLWDAHANVTATTQPSSSTISTPTRLSLLSRNETCHHGDGVNGSGSIVVDDYVTALRSAPVHRTVLNAVTGELAAASELGVAIWR